MVRCSQWNSLATLGYQALLIVRLSSFHASKPTQYHACRQSGWREMTWQNMPLLNPTSARAASPKKKCPPQGWLPPVMQLPVVQWALVYSFGGGHRGGVLVPQGGDRTKKQAGLLFLDSTWLSGLLYLSLPPLLTVTVHNMTLPVCSLSLTTARLQSIWKDNHFWPSCSLIANDYLSKYSKSPLCPHFRSSSQWAHRVNVSHC